MTRPAAEVEAEVEAQRSRLEETADALKDKMTPGEVFEEASRAAGDAGQQVLARFLDQARQNPMPVVLVGVGLVWLMRSSDRRGSAREGSSAIDPASGVSRQVAQARSGLASAVEAARDQARNAVHGFEDRTQRLGEKTQEVGEAFAQRAHDVSRTVSRSTHDLQDRGSQMASQVKEKVEDMKDQIGDTLAEVRDVGRSAAGQVSSTAQNTARLAQDSGRWIGQILDDVVHGEPLILGVVGLAVGFAIGSALPRSSVEDQTLGQAHDNLVAKGREVAHETLEQAGNIAQAAYAAARQELQPSVGDERGEGHQPKRETI